MHGSISDHLTFLHSDTAFILASCLQVPSFHTSASSHSPVLEQREDRLSASDGEKQFSFIHISKCGGTNFVSHISHFLNNTENCNFSTTGEKMHVSNEECQFYPERNHGQKHGFYFNQRERPNYQRLATIRASAREHIFAL